MGISLSYIRLVHVLVWLNDSVFLFLIVQFVDQIADDLKKRGGYIRAYVEQTYR